jgi:Transmembrane secretion effector
VNASEPVTEASAAGARDASARNTWVLVGFTAVTNLADGANKVTLPLIALCNELAGPPVGGLLVAAGVAIALGSTISAYLVAMIVLSFLVGRFRIVRGGDQPRPSVHRQISEGLRFLWHERLLRTLALTVTELVTCWTAWFALMPLVATKRIGLPADRYGALVSAEMMGRYNGAARLFS